MFKPSSESFCVTARSLVVDVICSLSASLDMCFNCNGYQLLSLKYTSSILMGHRVKGDYESIIIIHVHEGAGMAYRLKWLTSI